MTDFQNARYADLEEGHPLGAWVGVWNAIRGYAAVALPFAAIYLGCLLGSMGGV